MTVLKLFISLIIGTMLVAGIVAGAVMLSMKASADEAIPRGLGHPKDGGVHWYDSGCCNRKDCEAVEPGAIVATRDGYQVRYLTSRGFVAEGFIPHGSSAIRPSRDAMEHACAPTAERIACIYIHMGV